MRRDYQYDFSAHSANMHDVAGRRRKAETMLAVMRDCASAAIADACVLDLGASTGIIDYMLAEHCGKVVGVDIDETAIAHATQQYQRKNLAFRRGDAMHLDFPDGAFDIVVCTHVYEHVPDATRMMEEIWRVLKPGGICYFAAGNRLMFMEPHYRLPLLSVLPRPLAHVYLRLCRGLPSYHELHFTYWRLRALVARFELRDYTVRVIDEPDRFYTRYMLPAHSLKAWLAGAIAHHLYWLLPSYIWILRRKV